MPPLQVYAAYLALRQPPYNTGLFAELDGESCIRIDDLIARAAVAASSVGMTVPEGFEHECGRLLLDVPQVASILASALGHLNRRYGQDYAEYVTEWANETFGELLPPLDYEDKQAGIEYLLNMPFDDEICDQRIFTQAQEDCAEQLGSSAIVTAVDFLLHRGNALSEMYPQAHAD